VWCTKLAIRQFFSTQKSKHIVSYRSDTTGNYFEHGLLRNVSRYVTVSNYFLPTINVFIKCEYFLLGFYLYSKFT